MISSVLILLLITFYFHSGALYLSYFVNQYFCYPTANDMKTAGHEAIIWLHALPCQLWLIVANQTLFSGSRSALHYAALILLEFFVDIRLIILPEQFLIGRHIVCQRTGYPGGIHVVL